MQENQTTGDTNLSTEVSTQETIAVDTSTQAQDTGTTTQTVDTNTVSVKIPVKFLGEEKELGIDEAVPFIQKGMNYDHVFAENEKLKASLQAFEAEKLTFSEKAHKAEVQKYIDAGYGEEEAEDIVFARETKAKQSETEQLEKATKTVEERRQKTLDEFVSKVPDFKPADWTPEMLAAYEKGESLIPHYTEVQKKSLESENAELKKRLEALESNNSNRESSTGAIGSETIVDNDFISSETFETNKGDSNWVKSNLNKILKSRPKWSG